MNFRLEEVYVMLCSDDGKSGPAYTEAEWDASDNADYELSDGDWLFQGEPFCGLVEKRYECGGMRDVFAHDFQAAALTFGARLARRAYGSRGQVRILRLDSWPADHSYMRYSAFLGLRNRDGSTSGHNVWLNVYPA